MGARVLVLGLDGATWAVIDPLAAHLPGLRRLWEGGARAAVRSTVPPMTLPAWSTVLTGVDPGTHGILDFTRRVPGTYGLELLNATHRRVPTWPRILSDRGRRVASVAVPTTFPPERVNGVMVSGFDSPVATSVEAMHCEPRALHGEIAARFGGLKFADFQEGVIGPGWHEAALGRLHREIGRKEALCDHLLARDEWDLFFVVFGESDTAAHHFWMFHDPSSPRHQPRLRSALADVYRRLDAAVARLARHADTVCVVSDHGFGGAGDVAIYLNRFLEAHGWLRFGAPAPGGDRARQAALRLPVERIVRRLPPRLLGEAEARARYGGIHFGGTRAWSDELNYAATIHLNVRGRDPLGTIDDLDAAAADLGRLLLDWRIEGQPVVARVHRGRALFGACAGAPDLVLDLALRDGHSYTVLPSARAPAGTTWRRLTPDEHVGGKGLGMNGSHRPEGVLVLYGPAFRAGVTVDADLRDVLPTLLHVAGEAIPAHVEGRVLTDALRAPPATLPARPASPGAPAPGPARAYGRQDAARVRRRLERLGYG